MCTNCLPIEKHPNYHNTSSFRDLLTVIWSQKSGHFFGNNINKPKKISQIAFFFNRFLKILNQALELKYFSTVLRDKQLIGVFKRANSGIPFD